MKRLKFIPWLFILAGVGMMAFAVAGVFGIKMPTGENKLPDFFKQAPAAPQGPVDERSDITFILGEDEDSTNHFYAEATRYYRCHPTDRTELVVTDCRTLLAVREYLAKHPSRNHAPWGKVNLVVHGNEWSGLAVPVLPEGGRTTAAALADALGSKSLRPLPDQVADACTEFHVDGCGVGRDTALLRSLQLALGGGGELPQVVSSTYFIHFSSDKTMGKTVGCRRELLEAWYAFYPKTYRPANAELNRRLQKAYPKAHLDWLVALEKTAPNGPEEPYCHEFDLPIVWVVAYPDTQSLPDLAKWPAQRDWLDEQVELKQRLKEYGMPRDNFQWTFLTTKHRLGDGTEVPAIRAIGLCTVLTVLKAV